MSWPAIKVGDLPLVLAGPILRKECMAELPQLVELQINCYRLQRLPAGLAKLPSLTCSHR